MRAEVKTTSPNDHLSWDKFAQHESGDPYDDFGWFHVNVGLVGEDAGNDFQVCVSTPRAVGRAKHAGDAPGILVERFDAESVRRAIHDQIAAVTGHSWEHHALGIRGYGRFVVRRCTTRHGRVLPRHSHQTVWSR